MTDADELEGLLLRAAGARHPASMDISPILALLEEGYDLDRDIVPGIRDGVGKSRGPISSWRYFVPGIKQRGKAAQAAEAAEHKARMDGDFADGEQPVHWVRADDPRYDALAARWAAEKKGQRRPAPIESNYFKGRGWAFPAHWVGDR